MFVTLSYKSYLHFNWQLSVTLEDLYGVKHSCMSEKNKNFKK